MSIKYNNIQYNNSYCQLKYGPPYLHQIKSNQNLVDLAPHVQPLLNHMVIDNLPNYLFYFLISNLNQIPNIYQSLLI